jgi:hypothetical protein
MPANQALSITTTRTSSQYGGAISNTLLITQLEPDNFTGNRLGELRQHLEKYAGSKESTKIHQFIPLRSFGRIMVVFKHESDATRVKLALDHTTWYGKEIRVFFGESTPITSMGHQNLMVPNNDKLWLISPPGSPPVGWEQTREEPPNTETHAADLIAALERVAAQQRLEEEEAYASKESSVSKSNTTPKEGKLHTFMPSTTVHYACEQVTLPAIAVEDWDVQDETTISPTTSQPHPTICIHEAKTTLPTLCITNETGNKQTNDLFLTHTTQRRLPRTPLPQSHQ